MEGSNSELSGKVPAFVSWLQFIGLVMFLTSRTFFRQIGWLLWISTFFLLLGYGYRMYYDWKMGNKKGFRHRLFFLIIAIVIASIVAYLSWKKQ